MNTKDKDIRMSKVVRSNKRNKQKRLRHELEQVTIEIDQLSENIEELEKADKWDVRAND